MSVDSSITIRLGRTFNVIITQRGFVILRPTRTVIENIVGLHITLEEWEELSGLDSATLCGGCQRPEQQRRSTKRANSESYLHHTPSKRRCCLPLGMSIATTTTLTLLTSPCRLYAFLLFFALDVPLLYSFLMNANSTMICPCVLSRKSR